MNVIISLQYSIINVKCMYMGCVLSGLPVFQHLKNVFLKGIISS